MHAPRFRPALIFAFIALAATACFRQSPDTAILAELIPTPRGGFYDEGVEAEYLAFDDDHLASVWKSLSQRYRIAPKGTSLLCPSNPDRGMHGFVLGARVQMIDSDQAVGDIVQTCQKSGFTMTLVSSYLFHRREGDWRIDKPLSGGAYATGNPLGAVQILTPARRTVGAWITSGDQSRLLAKAADLHFTIAQPDPGIPVIDVDPSRTYQSIIGWGAAMSDAAAYLIQTKLNAAQREALLQDLFGREPGIGLSFVRIPMGASDFSRSHYSYDDRPPGETDSTLKHFSIEVDRAEKIPALKRALAINPQLKLVGSPWSAPGWMKSSGSLIKGTLLPRYYGSFAEYFRRWIQAYEAEGLPIFAITLQNEPHYEPENYPGMRLSPAQRAEIIGKHFGPLFAGRNVRAQIWDWDHNWDEIDSPLAVLADSVARRYVSAVAWHCYGGDISAQTIVHDKHPDKDTYFTECSGGEWAPVWADNLKWNVSKMVIGNARGWARGVALWNLALDEKHGPHLGGCGNCRGVVTINSVTGRVTRNPEYYALAHASRFVRPGAVRIESSSPPGLETAAFRNADDQSTALIVLNTTALDLRFGVRLGQASFSASLPGGAVATFVWK
jgi:glucosylceramidase